MSANKQTLIREAFPNFAKELEGLLLEEQEPQLVHQVADLTIIERCRCGDDFCATVYTRPRPKGFGGFTHRNVALHPKKGIIVLDIVDEQIVCVEVLYRDEIRQKLLSILP